jgi:hypothetical protein
MLSPMLSRKVEAQTRREVNATYKCMKTSMPAENAADKFAQPTFRQPNWLKSNSLKPLNWQKVNNNLWQCDQSVHLLSHGIAQFIIEDWYCTKIVRETVLYKMFTNSIAQNLSEWVLHKIFKNEYCTKSLRMVLHELLKIWYCTKNVFSSSLQHNCTNEELPTKQRYECDEEAICIYI